MRRVNVRPNLSAQVKLGYNGGLVELQCEACITPGLAGDGGESLAGGLGGLAISFYQWTPDNTDSQAPL